LGFRYSIVAGNLSLFSVNASTGWVSLLSSLDYEEQRSHVVVVRVTDNGVPPLFADVVVRVNVIDANDNAPVLARSLYTHRMPEDALDGTQLFAVGPASDADDGNNSRLTFTIVDQVPPPPFAISATTGVISKQGAVDFDFGPTVYEFNVSVVDAGVPPLGM
jgi:hypothetical protein